ncbi:MAG: hypothetical protein HY606_11980 [Planctomycetes bacterium]|nr:hypothetical protein [Planctomycetota bacterium]
MRRIYGAVVCSSVDSIMRHVAKHGLAVTPEEYVEIGDKLSRGHQGIFSGQYNGRGYTAVVDGKVCRPGENGNTEVYSLLRSLRRGVKN